MTAPKLRQDRIPPRWGNPLDEADFAALAESWITPEIGEAAVLRRVSAAEGREIVGQKGNRDCAGILFSYYWPGEPHPVNYRLRRDHPEMVSGPDGQMKADRKYLGAPGSGNRLYIPPGVAAEQLANVNIPLAIVEGEKKALALWRLANHESQTPRFIPVAIPGVWNWRGTIGKTGGPKGERLDVKGPIADLSRIEWTGRKVFVIYDANVHTNDSVKWARQGITREVKRRGAQPKLVTLPADCGVNGVDDLLAAWGPARVLELIEGAVDGGLLHVVASSQYEPRPEGMYRIAQQGEQSRQTILTNYTASIKSNVLLDDGVDVRREFEIEADLMGRHYNFTVPAANFSKMDWAIEHMGSAAITFPNQRDYARTAIQSCSMTADERHIYTHTGWRKVDGEFVFLHAGGAIGGNGALPAVEVRLGGAVNRYDLRVSGEADIPRAVRASLRLAALVAPPISFPLLAATYRAVFGNCDFALHLVGETGAFKSEVAALHQQHFGAGMDRTHLPGTWSSTGNSLEVLAFQAKDTLLIVDDFAPQGSAADVARYHAAADRVFRAAGNQAGKGRLDSTAKLREAKPPRSLILSTGEDIPKGHSVRARLLVLELDKGSINPNDLTACQKDAQSGLYAQSMGAFIQWIARNYEQISEALLKRISELRLESRSSGHARTPEIVANLQAGFECYLDYSVECGALAAVERESLAAQCWEALREAATAQGKHQAATEPTARFLDVLRACLSSGRAHLASRQGKVPNDPPTVCGWRANTDGNWIPLGDCIGWIEHEDIYLEPTSAYRLVQTAGRDTGESLPVSEQTLKKRLHEKGRLQSVDEARQTITVRRTIAGSSKNVLHFLRTTILPEASEDDTEDAG